mgnify:FL=1
MHEYEERDQWRHRVNAMICESKRRIPWREEAEERAALHSDCPRCQSGLRMEAFRCRFDPSHWHIGHSDGLMDAVLDQHEG